MSNGYIIPQTNAFVSVKLTDLGRASLAKASLNFTYFTIGDSEINYGREEIVEGDPTAYSATTKIFRPKDRQPDIKYFVSTGDTVLNPMTLANMRTIKAVVNNQADERGFFSRSGSTFTTLTGSTYIKATGILSNSLISGGTTIAIGTGVTRSVGDYILLKLGNNVSGSIASNNNTIPVPHLWYRIKTSSGGNITLDRNLPDIDSPAGTNIQYIIYPSGEVKDAFGSGSTTAYWDNGTLSFDSACDVSLSDVKVWNMNNVWSENLGGITGATTSYEDYTKFGSYDYIGTKDPYLGYDLIGSATSGTTNFCDGISGYDDAQKSVAILHYTNNTISNFYGEIFYIDNAQSKTVKVHLPTLMYNRRTFTGSTTGNIMGMTFLASGSTQTLAGTDIEYIDLIEDPTLGITPVKTVGRVFPQLQIVVIADEEIVAAMSYKSNRNWTLPALTATLQTSVSGTTYGVLAQNKTIYLTYALESNGLTGLTSTLPCQKYTKITNNTSTSKDIQFKLEDTGLLPYMRKIESSWDGLGFYAHKFKLLYQIIDNDSDRPVSDAWKSLEFSSTTLTSTAGQTINPIGLENQNPTINDFILTYPKSTGSTTYDLISVLNMAPVSTPTDLQFGDERFFYGNVEASIGATIYKTIFLITINANLFNQTSNITRSKTNSPTNIRVSEIGIYDSNQNLVVIGKLSTPIELTDNSTISIEASLDF